jgi:hypothetical protein
MIELKIKSKELPGVIKSMEEYPETINKNIINVFKVILPEIEKYAKMDAPVDTGRLRSDIGYRINQRMMEGVIYNTVEYAFYVHEGTSRMRARPYIKNAIKDQGRIRIKRGLEKNLLKKKRGLI